MRRRDRKRLAWNGLAVAGIVALGLGTFALPIRTWRTGEIAHPDIPTVRSEAARPDRIWIDTDPACGNGPRSDPDDCLALRMLARADGIELTGVSTVFGNAGIEVTDRIARDLAARLAASGYPLPDIVRGAAAATDTDTEAHAALANALASGRMTILALGPLTNIAAALRAEPSLADRVDRIVAVMGQHPGHLFHPSEGRGDGVLFGHGPIFSDLNFRKDPKAVSFLLSTDVPITLIPYEAARDVMVTSEDLDRIAATDAAGAWVARGAEEWLAFWQGEVGLDGFYPFDLVAARYVLRAGAFRCGTGMAYVDNGWAPEWLWILDDAGLFVEPTGEAGQGREVTYCPHIGPT